MADMKDARTTNTTELGRMIKQWRTAKNLSQRAAAEAIDILASTISDLENGKRRPNKRRLLIMEAPRFRLGSDGAMGKDKRIVRKNACLSDTTTPE